MSLSHFLFSHIIEVDNSDDADDAKSWGNQTRQLWSPCSSQADCQLAFALTILIYSLFFLTLASFIHNICIPHIQMPRAYFQLTLFLVIPTQTNYDHSSNSSQFNSFGFLGTYILSANDQITNQWKTQTHGTGTWIDLEMTAFTPWALLPWTTLKIEEEPQE